MTKLLVLFHRLSPQYVSVEKDLFNRHHLSKMYEIPQECLVTILTSE